MSGKASAAAPSAAPADGELSAIAKKSFYSQLAYNKRAKPEEYEQFHALYQSANPEAKKAMIQAWLANGKNMQIVMKEEMSNQMGTKDEALMGYCTPGQIADLTCTRRDYFDTLQEFQAQVGQKSWGDHVFFTSVFWCFCTIKMARNYDTLDANKNTIY